MKNKNLLGGLLVLGLLSSAVPVFAQEAWPDFSADVTQNVGGQTMQSKVFVSKDKTRMESMDQIIIIRRDLDVNWILMPQNMYMEQPLKSVSTMGMGAETAGMVERVSEGHETLEGQKVEKFRIKSQTEQGEMVMYQWMSADGLPVKMESADGKWGMFYQNVQKGPQPSELFEVPAGYQKMDLGMDMSQMMETMKNMQGEMES